MKTIMLLLVACMLNHTAYATQFIRGDTDGNGEINISDPIYSLAYQFAGGPCPPCFDADDVDDSGEIDISDPIYSLNYQFADGPEPLSPFPECGIDETQDNLDCFVHDWCDMLCFGVHRDSFKEDVDFDFNINTLYIKPYETSDQIFFELVLDIGQPITAFDGQFNYNKELLTFNRILVNESYDFDFVSASKNRHPYVIFVGIVTDFNILQELTSGKHSICTLIFDKIYFASWSDFYINGKVFITSNGKRFAIPDVLN